MKSMTMKKVYDVFGVTPKNPYWNWSGRCEYLKRAVVTSGETASKAASIMK